METFGKRILEEIIDWAVPVICAGALLFWKDLPEGIQHYWPVLCVFVVGLYSLIVAAQNRREIRRLRRIHEKADEREAERKIVEESNAKAFRAMLDDQMGSLYESCMAKGYTTLDERRRYERLHMAYKTQGGDGEADRRDACFKKIIDYETWKNERGQNHED